MPPICHGYKNEVQTLISLMNSYSGSSNRVCIVFKTSSANGNSLILNCSIKKRGRRALVAFPGNDRLILEDSLDHVAEGLFILSLNFEPLSTRQGPFP